MLNCCKLGTVSTSSATEVLSKFEWKRRKKSFLHSFKNILIEYLSNARVLDLHLQWDLIVIFLLILIFFWNSDDWFIKGWNSSVTCNFAIGIIIPVIYFFSYLRIFYALNLCCLRWKSFLRVLLYWGRNGSLLQLYYEIRHSPSDRLRNECLI